MKIALRKVALNGKFANTHNRERPASVPWHSTLVLMLIHLGTKKDNYSVVKYCIHIRRLGFNCVVQTLHFQVLKPNCILSNCVIAHDIVQCMIVFLLFAYSKGGRSSRASITSVTIQVVPEAIKQMLQPLKSRSEIGLTKPSDGLYTPKRSLL